MYTQSAGRRSDRWTILVGGTSRAARRRRTPMTAATSIRTTRLPPWH